MRFFEGQVGHVFSLVLLLLALGAATRLQGFDAGAFLGLPTTTWVVLAVAAFAHLYIWVHYHCTEKADMRRIYGA